MFTVIPGIPQDHDLTQRPLVSMQTDTFSIHLLATDMQYKSTMVLITIVYTLPEQNQFQMDSTQCLRSGGRSLQLFSSSRYCDDMQRIMLQQCIDWWHYQNL